MAKTNIPQNETGSDAATTRPLKPVNGTGRTTASQPDTETDPLNNINRFYKTVDYSQYTNNQKSHVLVQVRKPDSQQWVYFHPNPEWRKATGLFVVKATGISYLVEPELLEKFTEPLVYKLLPPYVTSSGAYGLWPIKAEDSSGRGLDSYSESALRIVIQNAGCWIRVKTDQEAKEYIFESAPENHVMPLKPKWPDGGIDAMISTGFKGLIIDSLEHAELQKLRGVKK